ncbi:hypothetical protein MFIFM68171_02945 [Madurella fahalii]|uniref:Uncharacterized protein n=1 Tax=Madurella fahalii TaxID=1157608 RepID=A0ABQ0G586_9PEZI
MDASSTAPCMRCLGTAENQFRADNGVISVSCRFNKATSSRCVRCISGKDMCETAPSGMAGDSVDLMLMLGFLRVLYRHTEEGDDGRPVYVFSEENRESFAVASHHLVQAFLSAVTTHLGQFGMAGKRKPSPDTYYKYGALVVARCRFNIEFVPPLVFAEGTTKDENMRVACRLQIGDQGAVAWTDAKRSLFGLVRRAIQADVEGENWRDVMERLGRHVVHVPTTFF